jgi:HEAT repeat protein
MNANLDQAFEALKTYDWGQERKLVEPIEAAIVASEGNAAQRREIETRLLAVLQGDAPYDAKQYVCRRLRVIGTAVSVPALAALLTDNKLSHMARFALERMPAAQAGDALRDALGEVEGKLKIGVMSSLATRGEAASVAPLAASLKADDAAVAQSAAQALGVIGTAEAAKALTAGVTDKNKAAVADALLVCAERALADGKKSDALTIYKGMSKDDQPKHVRLAATRGVLTCAGK